MGLSLREGICKMTQLAATYSDLSEENGEHESEGSC